MAKERIVRVFKEDPIWDGLARWWQISDKDRERLYVATYTVLAEDYDAMPRESIEWIRAQHPNCVLVHDGRWPDESEGSRVR